MASKQVCIRLPVIEIIGELERTTGLETRQRLNAEFGELRWMRRMAVRSIRAARRRASR